MKKRFKTKRKNNKLKYVIYLIIIGMAITLIYKSLRNTRIEETNSDLIENILLATNHHISYSENSNKYLYKLSSFISKFDPSKPETILKKVFGETKSEPKILAYNDNAIGYVRNDNIPRIYIYNTHQKEEYKRGTSDINPSIREASRILKSKLDSMGIYTLYEETDFSEYMEVNNLNFYESYSASKHYLKDTLNKYKNIDLIIDLHRDSVSKNISTTNINGVECAKIMFVVGTNYSEYKRGVDIANKLNDITKAKYPTLTRGLYIKNYTYNQEANPNMVLIEVGGNENNMDEVVNTINLLSEIIKDYLGA